MLFDYCWMSEIEHESSVDFDGHTFQSLRGYKKTQIPLEKCSLALYVRLCWQGILRAVWPSLHCSHPDQCVRPPRQLQHRHSPCDVGTHRQDIQSQKWVNKTPQSISMHRSCEQWITHRNLCLSYSGRNSCDCMWHWSCKKTVHPFLGMKSTSFNCRVSTV